MAYILYVKELFSSHYILIRSSCGIFKKEKKNETGQEPNEIDWPNQVSFLAVLMSKINDIILNHLRAKKKQTGL